MKKILFLLPILCLLVQPAHADCAFTGNGNEARDYTVLQSWDITHASDKDATGCLAKISSGEGETLVYTPYAFICKLPSDEKISLQLQQSCCDSGRQGDYPCGVMPKKLSISNLFSLPYDTQTSLTAVPAGIDKRAIPELIGKLETGSLYGIASVADKLVLFAHDPAFAADMQREQPRLQKAYNAGKNPMQKSYLARVLLALPSESTNIDLQLSLLENGFGDLDKEQLEALDIISAHPEAADKSILAILNRLNRASSSPEPLLDALAKMGPAAGPYLPLIHTRLHIASLSDTASLEKSLEELEAAAKKTDYNTLPDIERARKKSMAEHLQKQIAERNTEAKKILPFWEKIVCASRSNFSRTPEKIPGKFTYAVTDTEYNNIMSINCTP